MTMTIRPAADYRIPLALQVPDTATVNDFPVHQVDTTVPDYAAIAAMEQEVYEQAFRHDGAPQAAPETADAVAAFKRKARTTWVASMLLRMELSPSLFDLTPAYECELLNAMAALCQAPALEA